ncbi:MAG: hypothetical protein ATN35_01355 [Epulopiscium sp. Nele67-Bin004]|nr:MAG: hypothetical protein ATN35_01355 [Epulopiscium sp. Nele67-Bin004]
MSKYNFDLDLSGGDSLSKIIDRIKPDSTILEFGCAHGRLTKHLTEQMGAQVTIVEIDQEAGTEASQFATQSCIGEVDGNIENYNWAKLIQNKFDYILFADVLEHLYDPSAVLDKAKDFLEEDGSILVSIPNIAHHSIVVELLQNKFEYNEIGLLDNTHIRFYTKNSFIKMVEALDNLQIVEVDATYLGLEDSEFKNSYNDVSRNLRAGMELLDTGNEYQYIFEIKQGDHLMQKNFLKPNTNKTFEVFWAQKSREFNEQHSLHFQYAGDKFSRSIVLNCEKDTRFVRIDPISATSIIILHKVEFYKTERAIPHKLWATNAVVQVGNMFVFTTDDPQIIFKVKSPVHVILHLQILDIHLSEEMINMFEQLSTTNK